MYTQTDYVTRILSALTKGEAQLKPLSKIVLTPHQKNGLLLECKGKWYDPMTNHHSSVNFMLFGVPVKIVSKYQYNIHPGDLHTLGLYGEEWWMGAPIKHNDGGFSFTVNFDMPPLTPYESISFDYHDATSTTLDTIIDFR